MRFIIAVVLLVLLLPGPLLATPGDVLGSYPTPSHAPTGLAFDGNHLWLADRLTDSLYAVHPETGDIERVLPAPGFVVRGLAWDGSGLWVVDQEEQHISRLDPETGLTTHHLESPTPSIQGLAWDGQYLWIADDRADVICQISTADGTTIERFAAPHGKPTGLTWWNGYLWCADRADDRIYLVDPRHDGEVVLSLDAPGEHARGLATDGETLWHVDYQADSLYQLVIEDDDLYQTWDCHTLELTTIHEFRNYGPGRVVTADAYIALPHDMPNQNLRTELQFDREPTDILEDRWNQPVAHFRFLDLPRAERLQIKGRITVDLKAVRWFVYPHRVGELDDIPRDVREMYLVDEDKYRIEDERIVEAVEAAVGDETNPYWMMRNIHRYIRERMYYELSGGWNVAPRVLERGNGSCSEYTFLFISMCRAAGIPARYVGAVVIRGDEASTDEVFHRWSQVYLPGYGWIHIDPQGGDDEIPAEVAKSIGELSNRFLITTVGGGASEYLGWGYNYDHTWTGEGPVKLHAEFIGEWSPVVPDSTVDASMGTGEACEVD